VGDSNRSVYVRETIAGGSVAARTDHIFRY